MSEEIDGYENLLEINRNQNGDYYFIYSVKAPRSINPKAKRKAEKVIIVGVPQKKLISFLRSLSHKK